MSEKETCKGRDNEEGSDMVSTFCFSMEGEVSWGSGADLNHAYLPPLLSEAPQKVAQKRAKREAPSVRDRA